MRLEKTSGRIIFSGKDHLASGDSYACFGLGKPVDCWKLVNTGRFLFQDDGDRKVDIDRLISTVYTM